MTDYWVSRPKHFCSLCKVWCQGDQVSIKRHEDGPGHKNKLAHRLKAKRRTQQSSSSDVAAQLSQIEAAAAASMRETAASGSFAGTIDTNDFLESSQRRRNTGGGGPRGGVGRYEGDPTADFYEKFDARSFQQEEKKGEEEDDDVGGEYVVKGTRYYQGKTHAEKFTTGARCEVWVETAESWVPGVIKRVKRYASANGEERVYDVVAEKSEEEEEGKAGESLVEKHFRKLRRKDDTMMEEVNAKDIRVAGDLETGAWRPPETQDLPPEAPRSCSVEVDADTGFGKWTAVSVRQVDDTREDKQGEVKQEKKIKKIRASEQRARDEARVNCDAEESLQALNSHLGVYDRVDVYKRVRLVREEDEEKIAPKIEEEAVSSSVSFKKRKVENSRFRKKVIQSS